MGSVGTSLKRNVRPELDGDQNTGLLSTIKAHRSFLQIPIAFVRSAPMFSASLLAFILLLDGVAAAPSTTDSIEATATVPFASTESNTILWLPDADPSEVKPIRGGLGSSIIGPDNLPLDIENADLFAPPTTDHGSVYVALGIPLLHMLIPLQQELQVAVRVQS